MVTQDNLDRTVLALDSSTAMCSLAVTHGQRTLFEWAQHAPRGHSDLLHPAIAAALAQMGWQPAEAADRLEAIAVTTGPGSFTGLRIGIAAAKGLSHAWGLPLVGLPTLAVMAHAAGVCAKAGPACSGSPAANVAAIAAAVPTRREDCYAALYKPCAPSKEHPLGWCQVGETVAAPPAQALELLLGRRAGADGTLGDLPARYSEEPVGLCGVPWRLMAGTEPHDAQTVLMAEDLDWPLAKHLGAAAAVAMASGSGGPPDQIVPVYLRRPGLGPAPR